MPEVNISTDHKGNTYESQKEMCKAYNVAPSTFCKRIARGWDLKDALEGKEKVYYSIDGVDYRTKIDLCKAYNIHRNTFDRKLNEGQSIEVIIEKQPYMRVTGPDGTKYVNTDAMCEEYGIKTATFRKRMETYASMLAALTDPVRKRENNNGGESKGQEL